MSQNKWLVKHPEVEERLDLLFYRPLGYGLSLLLRPLPVTPDHVSIAAALVGVAAGHLFLYGRPAFDLAGALALVLSALLDSVDGQLARLRATHSRTGRMHDGLSDSLVFISVYLHLGARLVWEGGHPAWLLAALAGVLCQFTANATADLFRNSYLRHALQVEAENDSLGEVRAMREAASRERAGFVERLLLFFYVRVAAQQEAFNPRLAELRSVFARAAVRERERLATRYRELFRPLLPHLAWLGTNVRVVLLLVLLPLDAVRGFLWIGLTALNLALLVLVLVHERRARALLRETGAASPAAVAGAEAS